MPYRRKNSLRLSTWDYRWAGAYFITICTQNREHYFGSVKKGKMILSPIGVIADIFWHEMKFHFPYLALGEFVVMPNHMHGIIIIPPDDSTGLNIQVITQKSLEIRPSEIVRKENNTLLKEIDEEGKNIIMSAISPKAGSISTMVRSYKSAVSKHAHRLGFEFAWQAKFHSNIIKDEKAYQNITNYIANNPLRWDSDVFSQSDYTAAI